MRTIKFRGKRVDNGEWVYGYYLVKAEKHIIWSRADIQQYYVVPETVGLFMGLKDSKGVEIYEGDLIAEIDKMEELVKWGDPLTVEFGEFLGDNDSWGIPYCTTGFFLRYKDGQMTGIHNRETAYGFESKDIMIVGSIHQNPELL